METVPPLRPSPPLLQIAPIAASGIEGHDSD
jgi:hypothetical protein